MAQRAREGKAGFPGDGDVLAGAELFIPNPVRLHENWFTSAMATRAIVAELASDLVVTAIDDAHLESTDDTLGEKDLEGQLRLRDARKALRHGERMLENGDVRTMVACPFGYPEMDIPVTDSVLFIRLLKTG